MRTLTFEKLLQKSIHRTILILFKPFNLKKWMFLIMIASLAGAMGGGGSVGGGSSSSRTKDSEAWAQETSLTAEAQSLPDDEVLNSLKEKTLSPDGEEPGNGEEYVSAPPKEESDRDTQALWQGFRKFAGTPLGATVVTCLVLAVIGIFLVFTWLGARFRFIWFDSIVKNDASIRTPFFKYAPQADSLFCFFVVISLAGLSTLGLLAWWGYSVFAATGIMRGQKPGVWAVVGALTPVVLVFILFIVLLVLLALFIDHFVVPIMALDGCGFKTGWQKFTAVLSRNAKDFVLFCLLMLGLSIATSIMLFIAVCILLLAGLLAGGLLFGLLYLLTVTLLKLKILFAILALLIGVPVILAVIVVLMSISLPVAVFYRCFSLYFLSCLNAGYAPLPLEEKPPAAPTSPTPQAA